MSLPRVLFVNHTSQIAGAELVLLDVVERWTGASAFLFEDGPLNEAMTSLGIRVIGSAWGRDLSRFRRDSSIWNAIPLAGRLGAISWEIGRAARECDVVYANSQKSFVLAAVATAVCRRPLVWHLHDIIHRAHFGAMQRRIQIALANNRATQVIVPSQAAASAFIAEGGRRALVRVVPNGVNVAPETQSGLQIRRELGLSEGPLVGVFSRLAPWKGQHVVLAALAKLSDVNCIIAGDALFGEQAYAASLRDLAVKLGIADRVHFLGQRSDVTKLMQAVDVMVHPSVDPEPFGRTLVEAMFVKAPVIAADTGAASDILEGGAAGMLVTPNSPDELVAAITHVLSRPPDLGARVEYAAARARKHYSVGTMREGISSLIGQAASEARA